MTQQQQQQSQKSKSWMLSTFAFVAIGAFILPIEASNHIKASTDKIQKISKASETLLTYNNSLNWTTKGIKADKQINGVVFSPDGKTIASASEDKTIKIWNADTGEKIKTLNGHSAGVWSVTFSPNGKTIASASEDKTIKIWKSDGTLLHTLKGDNAKFTNLSFCPNGQEIVTAATDNTVKLWSVNGKLLRTFTGSHSSIDDLDCSPDSKTIGAASKDGTVVFWSRDGQESKIYEFKSLKNTEIEARKIAQMLGTKVIIGDQATESVVVQKIPSTKLLHIATHGRFYNSNSSISAISLDGNMTAHAKGRQVYIRKGDILWHTLRHSRQVSSIDWHPQNDKIITGCEDGTIHQWDANNGKPLLSIKVHESEVKKVNYKYNGLLITSESNTGSNIRFNSETNFIVVVFALFFGFIGSAILLFFVIKHRQNRRHNNTSNPKNSHIIIGLVVDIFPEDWIANLEALRYELIAANKPKWYVRFITVTTLLDMLCGGIQVKLQNFYDGDDLMAAIGRRSITNDRDNSIDE